MPWLAELQEWWRRPKRNLLGAIAELRGGAQVSGAASGGHQRRQLMQAREPFLSTDVMCEGRGASAQLIGYISSVKVQLPSSPPPWAHLPTTTITTLARTHHRSRVKSRCH